MAPADYGPSSGGSTLRGFSLVEVMAAVAISAIVLTAVISAFLYLGRSATRLAQSADLQSQVRRVLLEAGSDIRQATHATWQDANTLEVTVNGTVITYAYRSADHVFTRTPAGGTTRTLASDVASFQFNAFDLNGDAIDLTSDLTAASNATKMVQLSFLLDRNVQTTAPTTERSVSARFLMRNKNAS